MRAGISDKKIHSIAADCIVVPYVAKKPSAAFTALDRISKGSLSQFIKHSRFTGEHGKLAHFPLAGRNIKIAVVVGIDPKKIDATSLASITEKATAKALSHHCGHIAFCLEEAFDSLCAAQASRVIALTACNQTYRYTETVSKKSPAPSLKRCTLRASKPDTAQRRAVTEANAIHKGMCLTRELGNLPPNICKPEYLEKQARDVAKRYSNISIKVLDEAAAKRHGMGAFMSVTQGSHAQGRLICMHYKGASRKSATTALVGKGVTFDTGGISIKPSNAMDEMKFDMCGAASVLGVMVACAEMKLPMNLVCALACVENMPGGNASRPGDVVTTMSGQTVEILNTDAEGRLILCDALTYVNEKYKPDEMIDIATLTGACIVALGHECSGLMTNNSELGKRILDAGVSAGDRAWELPLWDDYQSQLDSNFADMANIGGRGAGTITAACFLARFTKKVKWAHLDIAGTAWHTGANKGATGRPVPLLTAFLIAKANGDN